MKRRSSLAPQMAPSEFLFNSGSGRPRSERDNSFFNRSQLPSAPAIRMFARIVCQIGTEPRYPQ